MQAAKRCYHTKTTGKVAAGNWKHEKLQAPKHSQVRGHTRGNHCPLASVVHGVLQQRGFEKGKLFYLKQSHTVNSITVFEIRCWTNQKIPVDWCKPKYCPWWKTYPQPWSTCTTKTSRIVIWSLKILCFMKLMKQWVNY